MKKKKRILILASTPHGADGTRLGNEVREIKQALARSKYRRKFVVDIWFAVRAGDISQAILKFKPHIVHFCGQGKESGLILEDENGRPVMLQPDALGGMFKHFSQIVDCVVLNAGHSRFQAEAINRYIGVVIGMSGDLPGEANTAFAEGFYDALGSGKSCEEAFRFGENGVKTVSPHSNAPVLYTREEKAVSPPLKVFLCYSHIDKALVAEPLARRLKHYGIEVWQDEGAILPGDSLIQTIRRGIRESDYFLVLISPNSVNSPWVNFELGLAYEQFKEEEITIIPAIFGNCALPGFLTSFVYVDFRELFTHGLKELLGIFKVPSRLLSEKQTKKLVQLTMGEPAEEYIKEYVLSNDKPGHDNNREEAIKKVKQANFKYVVLGALLTLLGLSDGLATLLYMISPRLVAYASLFMIVLAAWGGWLTTRYFVPRLTVDRYFKLLARYEALCSDIEPDILENAPGDLYYEFMDDAEKRFYRIHHIGDGDRSRSIRMCRNRYSKYFLVIMLLYLGLELYAGTHPEAGQFLMSSRFIILFLTYFTYWAYKSQVKRIRKMHDMKEGFEGLKDYLAKRAKGEENHEKSHEKSHEKKEEDIDPGVKSD